MEPFLGEIKMVAFDFAPSGFARCDGQILSIQDHTALYSLLGTTYGGDGWQTFALPDLRGRIPMHWEPYSGPNALGPGEVLGEETHTLTSQELPSHTHPIGNLSLPCSVEDGATGSPSGGFPAVPNGAGGTVNAYKATASPGKALGNSGATGTAQSAGGSQPHNNLQPYLVINFIIALEGVYPSRP